MRLESSVTKPGSARLERRDVDLELDVGRRREKFEGAVDHPVIDDGSIAHALRELVEARQGEELTAWHLESHEQFESAEWLGGAERHQRLGEGDEVAALERLLERL